jgi:hypothetical protein
VARRQVEDTVMGRNHKLNRSAPREAVITPSISVQGLAWHRLWHFVPFSAMGLVPVHKPPLLDPARRLG